MAKKKINKTVYVVGSAVNYARFIKDAILVDNIEDAAIVLFTGGEDVSPRLYGRERLDCTYSNIERDKKEMAIFKKVQPSQICVGICRGSQFLCVMNGGVLVQDVDNHGLFGTHPIITAKNEIYEITSTHHQMQYPFNLPDKDYDLIAVSDRRSSVYLGIENNEIDALLKHGEPEVVLYHKENCPKCLAIQGHPEMMRENAPVVEWINTLIDKLLK